ncbi:MAG TPA: branched-chain amino acid ABC transporter substrate-binding protein [Solirubrobacteraceae bacterium]|nr:branched-chain amino acid ABC transporter substrate-binding protein [Solirubrobacteraceae bacterium]
MRWLCLAALAVVVPVAVSGCGGVGVSGASEVTGNQLAIYSSLPLQGPAASSSAEIVNGERLALAQAGGHVGQFKVGYVSLDDANPQTGKLDPEATSTNAKTAAQDTSTIAYLGELESAATAVSLPLINAAGILQVSPGSPYVGLTSSLDAGQDEPERFYPSAKRTFGRLQPGDPAQARAQVKLMQALGVKSLYVLDDQDPFELPLVEIVAGEATRAGIAVVGHDSVATTAATATAYASEAEKIERKSPEAVFLAGGARPGAAALWRALHSADPHLLLLGPDTLDTPSFTGSIGAAQAQTYLTTPLLPIADYPPPAAGVLADYRRHFGGSPGPYALYGYEAMSVVLDAIRRAGRRGNDRPTVIERFFQTHDRDSVLGRYTVLPSGETTLARYGTDRVSGGRARFFRAIELG